MSLSARDAAEAEVRVRPARSCYLCEAPGEALYQGLRDRLFTAPGTWSLRECRGCGLAWLDPRPLTEDLGRLYTTYYTHQDGRALTASRGLRALVRDAVLARVMGYPALATGPLQRAAGAMLGAIPPLREAADLSVRSLPGSRVGRLLDVGCGDGHFLARMRQLGWDVTGVEPDATAARAAWERFRVPAHAGSLEDAGLAPESFDAITLNHVVEHLPDPVATLRECRRLLVPGGRLVLVTPNLESRGHRSFGAAWLHLDPPRHLYLFTPRSLAACVEAADLGVVQSRTTARVASTSWRASRAIRSAGALPGGAPARAGAGERMRAALFQLAEMAAAAAGPSGEEISLVATRAA